MRVLLTGGSGDLGRMLIPKLIAANHQPVIFDINPPKHKGGEYVRGSVLNKLQTKKAFWGADIVIHIAAWHGIHEARGEKTPYEFFDLNVGGTFNVFEAAAKTKTEKIILISSTSATNIKSIYGQSKILAEQIAKGYVKRKNIKVITLRPRAFIPYWNKTVYPSYLEWAQWFWRGAVHITDVVQSVERAIHAIDSVAVKRMPTYIVDGAYEYSKMDLIEWDKNGPGSTFLKHYQQYYNLALKYGLDLSLKPKRLNMENTIRDLDYKPQYSVKNLLMELKKYGAEGPPTP